MLSSKAAMIWPAVPVIVPAAETFRVPLLFAVATVVMVLAAMLPVSFAVIA